MSDPRSCESCGARLSADAPEGLCAACLMKSALEESSDLRLGDFEIIEEIARGGMGVVYRARQRSLDRLIALKVILVGQWASRSQIERFQMEAEAAAKLDHPNIVPVYEVGEAEGQRYLCMRLIEGGNLGTRLQDFRQDHRRAARLVSTVARAVHFAHQHRILHRDLKPTNILVDVQGEPHVTDFGLAKMLESNSDFTHSLSVLGTPSYMAPEQAMGNTRAAGVPSDIYSLGAILYELLTGQPPFGGATPLDVLQQARENAPRSPRAFNGNIDRDLETICLKCLEKEPWRRYETAEALAADLDRWQEGRPILARPVNPLVKLAMWCRRQPAAAAVVTLLCLFAIGLFVTAQILRRQRDQARQHLWESSLSQAAKLRTSSAAGRRQQGLEALRKAADIRPSVEVRNEAIACLALQDLRIRHRWAGFPEGTTALCMDVQQEHYARAATGNISVREIASDRAIAALIAPAEVDWLRFSPDAKYLAARLGFAAGNCQVCVWEWKTGAQVLNVPLPQIRAVPVAFDAKSEWLFLGTQDGRIRRLALLRGEEAPSISVGFTPAQICPSPGGDWIAVSFSGADLELNRTVRVLPLGNSEQAVFTYQGNVRSLAWHPNGQVLAVGCNGYHIYEDEVATQKRLKVSERHETPVIDLAYNSDGSLMASASHDGKLVLWDAMAEQIVIAGRAQRTQLAFAPGSNHLAVGIDPPDLTLWDIERNDVFFQVPKTITYCSGLDISADGRWVVIANLFTGLLLADLEERKLVAQSGKIQVRSVWFDKVGQHFLSSGRGGLQRWPLVNGGFGEPTKLEFPKDTPLDAAASPAGGKLAVSVNFADLVVGEPGSRTNWHSLNAPYAQRMRFSPDGRWLAAIRGHEDLWVWDVESFQTARLVSSNTSAAVFAPNGHWLLSASGRQFRIWEVGSWKLLRIIQAEDVKDVESPAHFSPDGSLLALAHGLQTVQLLDARTGLELATLRAPEPSAVHWVQFTPDGHRLVVMTRTRGLQVWDLRALRRELAAMGLDWSQ